MGLFDRFRKKKTQPVETPELPMRKPRNKYLAPKTKTEYKVECEVTYKDESIGRFTFIAKAWSRRQLVADLEKAVSVKIGKASIL